MLPLGLLTSLGGIGLQIGVALATKLLSERFISRGVVLTLKALSRRTATPWDDQLVGYIRDEIAPDMQLEQPEGWVVHETTETVVLPQAMSQGAPGGSPKGNLVERKGAM